MSGHLSATGPTVRSLTLPAEWRGSSIGELFDVQQGKALSPQARQGKSPRPFLRTANVLWARLDLAKLDRMDFDPAEAERLALKDRDLLVCEGGEIGRTAIWRCEVPGCLYQNHIHRLRRKDVNVEPEFVMYWLQAAFFSLRLFGGAGNKTTIPNLSAARLKTLFVPKPSGLEQRAIAGVLAKIQRALEVEDRRIAALKELKAATMAKVFREGLRGEPLKPTEIGEIPESWEVLPLGRVCELASGGTPARDHPEFWGGTIPWVKTGEIDYCEITSTAEHITELGLANSAARVFPRGTLLMAMYGQGVTRGKVAFLGIAAATNQACAAFFPDETALLPGFLYAYCTFAYNRIRELGHGANQKNLSAKLLKAMAIPVPRDLAEQQAVYDLLLTINRRIEVAERRGASVQDLFASALNQLMTGQVRVRPLLEKGEAPDA